MNNTDSNPVKHVVFQGNIYIVDFSAPAPVWTYAMPLSLWAVRQRDQNHKQVSKLRP